MLPAQANKQGDVYGRWEMKKRGNEDAQINGQLKKLSGKKRNNRA